MNLDQGGDSETRFAAYVAGLGSVIGHAERMGPLRDYCTGLMLPGERKSVEPMAARTAPARTAAQHQSLLHFVGIAAWSDEDVLAKVREMVLPAIEKERTDRGVDHRRHLVPQARQAFGRRAPPILRSARQAGQLPGGGVAVDCQSCRQPSGGLSAVPAGSLDEGSCAAEEGRRAEGDQVQDQAADRAGANPLGLRERSATRRRVDGCGLRQGRAAACRHDGIGRALRGRHRAEHLDVGPWQRPAADGQADEQHRPPRRARTGLGQESGARSTEAGLAHGDVAGRLGRPAILALRACACPRRVQQTDPREAVA